MFCNGCGAEMQAAVSVCSRCGKAFGLVGNSLSPTVRQSPSPHIAVEPTGYYFGRFYAILKIAGGLVLALMIFFHASWITPLPKGRLELTAVISLVTGYGLLKKQMWGLYLLTAAFLMSTLQVVTASQRHIPISVLPLGVIWNLIGLWYFWEHRRELE